MKTCLTRAIVIFLTALFFVPEPGIAGDWRSAFTSNQTSSQTARLSALWASQALNLRAIASERRPMDGSAAAIVEQAAAHLERAIGLRQPHPRRGFLRWAGLFTTATATLTAQTPSGRYHPRVSDPRKGPTAEQVAAQNARFTDTQFENAWNTGLTDPRMINNRHTMGTVVRENSRAQAAKFSGSRAGVEELLAQSSRQRTNTRNTDINRVPRAVLGYNQGIAIKDAVVFNDYATPNPFRRLESPLSYAYKGDNGVLHKSWRFMRALLFEGGFKLYSQSILDTGWQRVMVAAAKVNVTFAEIEEVAEQESRAEMADWYAPPIIELEIRKLELDIQTLEVDIAGREADYATAASPDKLATIDKLKNDLAEKKMQLKAKPTELENAKIALAKYATWEDDRPFPTAWINPHAPRVVMNRQTLIGVFNWDFTNQDPDHVREFATEPTVQERLKEFLGDEAPPSSFDLTDPAFRAFLMKRFADLEDPLVSGTPRGPRDPSIPDETLSIHELADIPAENATLAASKTETRMRFIQDQYKELAELKNLESKPTWEVDFAASLGFLSANVTPRVREQYPDLTQRDHLMNQLGDLRVQLGHEMMADRIRVRNEYKTKRQDLLRALTQAQSHSAEIHRLWTLWLERLKSANQAKQVADSDPVVGLAIILCQIEKEFTALEIELQKAAAAQALLQTYTPTSSATLSRELQAHDDKVVGGLETLGGQDLVMPTVEVEEKETPGEVTPPARKPGLLDRLKRRPASSPKPKEGPQARLHEASHWLGAIALFVVVGAATLAAQTTVGTGTQAASQGLFQYLFIEFIHLPFLSDLSRWIATISILSSMISSPHIQKWRKKSFRYRWWLGVLGVAWVWVTPTPWSISLMTGLLVTLFAYLTRPRMQDHFTSRNPLFGYIVFWGKRKWHRPFTYVGQALLFVSLFLGLLWPTLRSTFSERVQTASQESPVVLSVSSEHIMPNIPYSAPPSLFGIVTRPFPSARTTVAAGQYAVVWDGAYDDELRATMRELNQDMQSVGLSIQFDESSTMNPHEGMSGMKAKKNPADDALKEDLKNFRQRIAAYKIAWRKHKNAAGLVPTASDQLPYSLQVEALWLSTLKQRIEFEARERFSQWDKKVKRPFTTLQGGAGTTKGASVSPTSAITLATQEINDSILLEYSFTRDQLWTYYCELQNSKAFLKFSHVIRKNDLEEIAYFSIPMSSIFYSNSKEASRQFVPNIAKVGAEFRFQLGVALPDNLTTAFDSKSVKLIGVYEKDAKNIDVELKHPWPSDTNVLGLVTLPSIADEETAPHVTAKVDYLKAKVAHLSRLADALNKEAQRLEQDRRKLVGTAKVNTAMDLREALKNLRDYKIELESAISQTSDDLHTAQQEGPSSSDSFPTHPLESRFYPLDHSYGVVTENNPTGVWRPRYPLQLSIQADVPGPLADAFQNSREFLIYLPNVKEPIKIQGNQRTDYPERTLSNNVRTFTPLVSKDQLGHSFGLSGSRAPGTGVASIAPEPSGASAARTEDTRGTVSTPKAKKAKELDAPAKQEPKDPKTSPTPGWFDKTWKFFLGELRAIGETTPRLVTGVLLLPLLGICGEVAMQIPMIQSAPPTLLYIGMGILASVGWYMTSQGIAAVGRRIHSSPPSTISSTTRSALSTERGGTETLHRRSGTLPTLFERISQGAQATEAITRSSDAGCTHPLASNASLRRHILTYIEAAENLDAFQSILLPHHLDAGTARQQLLAAFDEFLQNTTIVTMNDDEGELLLHRSGHFVYIDIDLLRLAENHQNPVILPLLFTYVIAHPKYRQPMTSEDALEIIAVKKQVEREFEQHFAETWNALAPNTLSTQIQGLLPTSSAGHFIGDPAHSEPLGDDELRTETYNMEWTLNDFEARVIQPALRAVIKVLNAIGVVSPLVKSTGRLLHATWLLSTSRFGDDIWLGMSFVFNWQYRLQLALQPANAKTTYYPLACFLLLLSVYWLTSYPGLLMSFLSLLVGTNTLWAGLIGGGIESFNKFLTNYWEALMHLDTLARPAKEQFARDSIFIVMMSMFIMGSVFRIMAEIIVTITLKACLVFVNLLDAALTLSQKFKRRTRKNALSNPNAPSNAPSSDAGVVNRLNVAMENPLTPTDEKYTQHRSYLERLAASVIPRIYTRIGITPFEEPSEEMRLIAQCAFDWVRNPMLPNHPFFDRYQLYLPSEDELLQRAAHRAHVSAPRWEELRLANQSVRVEWARRMEWERVAAVKSEFHRQATGILFLLTAYDMLGTAEIFESPAIKHAGNVNTALQAADERFVTLLRPTEALDSNEELLRRQWSLNAREFKRYNKQFLLMHYVYDGIMFGTPQEQHRIQSVLSSHIPANSFESRLLDYYIYRHRSPTSMPLNAEPIPPDLDEETRLIQERPQMLQEYVLVWVRRLSKEDSDAEDALLKSLAPSGDDPDSPLSDSRFLKDRYLVDENNQPAISVAGLYKIHEYASSLKEELLYALGGNYSIFGSAPIYEDGALLTTRQQTRPHLQKLAMETMGEVCAVFFSGLHENFIREVEIRLTDHAPGSANARIILALFHTIRQHMLHNPAAILYSSIERYYRRQFLNAAGTVSITPNPFLQAANELLTLLMLYPERYEAAIARVRRRNPALARDLSQRIESLPEVLALHNIRVLVAGPNDHETIESRLPGVENQSSNTIILRRARSSMVNPETPEETPPQESHGWRRFLRRNRITRAVNRLAAA